MVGLGQGHTVIPKILLTPGPGPSTIEEGSNLNLKNTLKYGIQSNHDHRSPEQFFQLIEQHCLAIKSSQDNVLE